jgi:hypothetical protein
MSRFKNYREIYDQLICLPEESKSDPMQVVMDFFDDYRLSELRQIQNEIERVCLTTDEPPFDEPKERANFLSYSEKLICLLEAVLLLTSRASEVGPPARVVEK